MNVRLVAFGLIGIAASASALAQQRSTQAAATAKLSGTISDGTSPVIAAGVTILDSRLVFVNSTITERTGKYEIAGLRPQTKYWAKFCHQEYTTVFREVTAPATADIQLS